MKVIRIRVCRLPGVPALSSWRETSSFSAPSWASSSSSGRTTTSAGSSGEAENSFYQRAFVPWLLSWSLLSVVFIIYSDWPSVLRGNRCNKLSLGSVRPQKAVVFFFFLLFIMCVFMLLCLCYYDILPRFAFDASLQNVEQTTFLFGLANTLSFGANQP